MENENQEIYTAIYDVVRLIPKGRVTSYGAVAKAVGLKSGARMVARAMSMAREVNPPVPAHRVVNSSGIVMGDQGHRGKELLYEGIQINGDKIVDFKNIFWDPLKEI
jgi:methylated-DNA-protein-cysteine methyltransferase-like protein